MKTINNNALGDLYHILNESESFVYFDTSKPDQQNRRSLLFLTPQQRLRYFAGEDEKAFLARVQELQEEGYYIAGWFSYEFGYLFEPNLKKLLCREEDKGALLADLGVFEKCYSFDHISGECNFPFFQHDTKQFDDEYHLTRLRLSQSREEYLGALAKILEYIRAGDTYQVNYTLKLFFELHGSAEKFYDDLRRNQSVGYGAYLRLPGQRIMSFSPELFFWKKDSHVMVRPMKGTLRRGRTVEEDALNREFLRTDIKNQSENVMIVDLLRNDLGRLMHYLADGDVQVDSLFDVETYETLLQMTSTITGRTRPEVLAGVSLYAFFKAIFPCGSVTGAPKIRTMEIINELEKQRRGVYTGAIGFISPSGEAVFNVPIRTVVLKGSIGEMGIGSGIVHDSVPEKEWQECLLKGRFLTAPQKSFYLFETILWRPSKGYWLIELHLQRLFDSAKHFLFSCDEGEIVKTLRDAEVNFPPHAMRVRLCLEKDGTIRIEATACDPPNNESLPLQLAADLAHLPRIEIQREKTDATDTWLYHKTSNREFYRAEYDKAGAKGLVDVVFTNTAGRLTEGCISNIFLLSNGVFSTPPLHDGLLPGVMRRYLLENFSDITEEKSLTIKDVMEAEAIYLCNSVRGIFQVALR